jgi:hypothetical protein
VADVGGLFQRDIRMQPVRHDPHLVDRGSMQSQQGLLEQ